MDSLLGPFASAGIGPAIAVVSSRIRASLEGRAEEPLGLMARRIFAAQCRSSHRQVHSHFRKNLKVRLNLLNHLGRAWSFGRRHAGSVKRTRGLSLTHQAGELLRLTVGYGVDPATYYAHQLYDAPDGIAEVEYYLGRHEMKNGLYSLLNELRRSDPNYGLSLSEKVQFAEQCRKAGLRSAPVLAVAKAGGWNFVDPDPHAFERDLFVKTVRGRGASGAAAYRFAGADRYLGAGEATFTRQGLMDRVASSASDQQMMIVPRLVNHPEIADLAGQSLIAFRVFTCLDAAGDPVVTHAMLRTLCKLEPDWHTEEEFAAPVDLASGRLGPMWGDAELGPDSSWDRHPKTGAPVAGRVIANWPSVAALAVQAHRAFSGRTVIGWDLALTPDGPYVIEGNSDADTHYLQRVHRQMIGRSPMAPLLRHHLRAAEALLAG